MGEELRAINIKIPVTVYEQIKILAIVNQSTMKDVIVDAILKYQSFPELKGKIKNLQHKIYRLKHDSYEKGE